MAHSIRQSKKFDLSLMFIIVPDPEKWRMNDTYRCRHCGKPAYVDPNSQWLWGCIGELCRYATEALSHFFKPVFLITEGERDAIIATD